MAHPCEETLQHVRGNAALTMFKNLRRMGTAHIFCMPAKKVPNGDFDVVQVTLTPNLAFIWVSLMEEYVQISCEKAVEITKNFLNQYSFVHYNILVTHNANLWDLHNNPLPLVVNHHTKTIEIVHRNPAKFRGIHVNLLAKEGSKHVHLTKLRLKNTLLIGTDFSDQNMTVESLELDNSDVSEPLSIVIETCTIYDRLPEYAIKNLENCKKFIIKFTDWDYFYYLFEVDHGEPLRWMLCQMFAELTGRNVEYEICEPQEGGEIYNRVIEYIRYNIKN